MPFKNIRLHNLIAMNIFFTIKGHSFFFNFKEKAETKYIKKTL